MVLPNSFHNMNYFSSETKYREKSWMLKDEKTKEFLDQLPHPPKNIFKIQIIQWIFKSLI